MHFFKHNTQSSVKQHSDEVLLEWHAPTQPHHIRSTLWYIVAATIVCLLLAYSIYTGAWTFTAVIVVMVISYMCVHHKEPPEHHMQIRERGFFFNNQYTAWKDCEGFWVLHNDHYAELHIQRKTGVKHHLVIQTGAMDYHHIRQVLHNLLPEHVHAEEELLDMIIRICKL